jgi:VCBS repeat-containing protein
MSTRSHVPVPIQHRFHRLLTCVITALLGVGLSLPFASVVATPASANVTNCANVTVTSMTDPTFYVDYSATPAFRSNYAGYRITNNTGGALNEWLKVTQPNGATIVLYNDTATRQISGLANGASTTAYFYNRYAGADPGSHDVILTEAQTITLYDIRPDLPGATPQCTYTPLTYSRVTSLVQAQSNTITSSISGPNPPGLGGVVTMTVSATGADGTGSFGSGPSYDPAAFAMTPAAQDNWFANAYRLTGVSITFGTGLTVPIATNPSCTALTGADVGKTSCKDNLWYKAMSGNGNYTIVYTFVATGVTTAAVQVYPLQDVPSGNNMKHTSTTGYSNASNFPPIQPAANYVTMSKTASTPTFPSAGSTVGYTVTATNTSSLSSSLDSIQDTLPSGFSYVAGSAKWAGTSVGDPSISGQVLTFVGPFTVPASGSASLTYNVTTGSVPAAGHTTRSNSAIAYIGTTVIDTTVANTTDNVPAAATVTSNDAPVANADTPLVQKNSSSNTITVLGNDTDANGDTLTVTGNTPVAHGTLTPSGNTFSYTPTNGYSGTDSFTYTISDGQGGTATGTVTITVNAPPVVGNDSFTTNEDTPLSTTVAGNDSDPEGGTLTYSKVTSPAHGTLTFNSNTTGAFTYSPAQDYNGSDSFNYQACDPTGACTGGTVSLTITPVNDAPVATPSSQTAVENTPLNASVSATDVDSPTLTYAKATNPSHGTVTVNSNGTYTYTPATNYSGPDSFTFTANDGFLTSAPATVSITVSFVNQAPVAINSAPSTLEDTALHASVSATDVDSPTLTYAKASGPSHGTLVLNTDGTYTYTPAQDYNGSDSFTFTANDGSLTSAPGTVSITVTPVNDAPVATASSATTAEDTVLHASVSATDVDSPTLTYAKASGPSHGTLVLNTDGTYTYTPAQDYNGSDSFTFTANDGQLTSAPATVSLTITPVNDAPVATASSATTAEDTVLNSSVSATDVDSPTLTYAVGTGPSHGSLTLNANGTYSYTPAADYNGSDSFTFTANDGFLTSAPATVSITVTPVNDAPVATASSATTAEDTVLNSSVSATDVDSPTLTYAKASGPSHGTVTVNSDGTYTYTPALNYNGPDSFTFTANDGFLTSAPATVSLTVTPVNDAPVATASSATTAEDTALSSSVSATDVDSPTLTYAKASGPSHGTLVLNSDGTYTYTPAQDYNGPDSFTFTANDGFLTSAPATVSLTVTPVNDAPVATPSSQTAVEDTPLNASVSATDVDSPTLTYAKVTGPAHGSLTLNANGTYTYTPAANYNGPDSFTFTANDGLLTSAPATVSITVSPVNDAPVATGAAATVTAGQPFSGSVSATDVDGDTLTYATVSGPSHGTLTLNPDGTYTYTADAAYVGSDSFTFQASDGVASSNIATVSLTVQAPTAVSGTVTSALTGLPIAGATVTVYKDTDNTPLASTTTAADGTYKVTLSANFTIYVGFSASGYVDQYWNNKATAALANRFTVPAHTTATGKNAVLGQIGIVGTVYAKLDGQPIPGTAISLIRINGGGVQANTTSDANGHYLFSNVPDGQYTIRYTGPWQMIEYIGGGRVYPDAQFITITAGTIYQEDYWLDPAGTFTGSVTDVNGQGIAGVTVRLLQADTGLTYRSFTTDATGHWSTPMMPVWDYKVRYEAAGYVMTYWGGNPTLETSATMTIVASTNVDTAPQVMVRIAEIHGTVSNAAGPLAGVKIHAYDSTGTLISTVNTAADGTWTVTKLSEGDYTIQASATGYVTKWWINGTTAATATRIHVGPGGQVSGINITLAAK